MYLQLNNTTLLHASVNETLNGITNEIDGQ